MHSTVFSSRGEEKESEQHPPSCCSALAFTHSGANPSVPPGRTKRLHLHLPQAQLEPAPAQTSPILPACSAGLLGKQPFHTWLPGILQAVRAGHTQKQTAGRKPRYAA